MPPFFLQNLGSSLRSFLSSFSDNYLSLLHLVILVGFSLVPSSGTYSFAVSFCLTFCVCDLQSLECRVVGPFASGVCLLVGEANLETCVGFLVGRTSACPLVGGAESYLSL